MICGLGPIVLNVQDISRTENILTGVMNMRRERDYAAPEAPWRGSTYLRWVTAVRPRSRM